MASGLGDSFMSPPTSFLQGDRGEKGDRGEQVSRDGNAVPSVPLLFIRLGYAPWTEHSGDAPSVFLLTRAEMACQASQGPQGPR